VSADRKEYDRRYREKARQKRIEYDREYRRRTRKEARSKNLLKKYGITLAEYDRLHSEQDGACAICGRAESRVDGRTGRVLPLAVDHCHANGHVRGLLCASCNKGLGVFRDDPALLRRGAAYLESRATTKRRK
jgi:hypothetical protein